MADEELGEKRLNFFISLLTAAAAGLVLLATSESGFTDAQVQWLSFATGVALLILGLSTLLRMLRRNNVADQYKRAMDNVRDMFRSRYGSTSTSLSSISHAGSSQEVSRRRPRSSTA